MFPFFCSSTSSVPPLTYTLWSLSIIPKMSLPQTLPTPFFSLFSTAGAIELLHPQRQSNPFKAGASASTPTEQRHVHMPLSVLSFFVFKQTVGLCESVIWPNIPQHTPSHPRLSHPQFIGYLFIHYFFVLPHILFSAISTVLSICWHQSF